MLSKINQTQKATYSIILLIWYSEKAKLSEVNTNQWMPGTVLGDGLTIKGYDDNFRDDGLWWFYGYAFAKIYRMCLKGINFSVCKLYLNKFDFIKKCNNNNKPVIH